MPNLSQSTIPSGKLISIYHGWHHVDKIARQKALSIFIVALLSFGGSWVWALYRGIPTPYAHDEFNYLLAADTFVHGRVTNPTHPMWIHFETFFALQHPTYMAMYPPAQGAFLAIGKILFGHPIYGAWLSSSLLSAAICWMLYAWVSPRWALIGGLVAAMQFGIFTYWSQSYWGGAVAGMGGALVFGALPRIFKTQRIRDALWLGLGCAVLANSRPEAFPTAISVGCLVLPWKIRWQKLVLVNFVKRIILPLSLVLFITVLGVRAYNKQITGDAGVFPYLLYAQNHRPVPLLIWQPIDPKITFTHKVMELHEKNYAEWYYLNKRTWKGFLKGLKRDTFVVSMFFFGYPLAFPSLFFLAMFFIYHQTALRFWSALMILLGTFAAMTFFATPHYFSPLTCLAVLSVVIGLRGLAGLRLRKARVGLGLVTLLIIFQLILNIILTPVLPKIRSLARVVGNTQGASMPASFTREDLKNVLKKRGGKYLVIVKYSLSHNFFLDWVFNGADIDHAPIVWARDMDEARNKELLEYFKDRQVLFIEVYWDMYGFPRYYARQ